MKSRTRTQDKGLLVGIVGLGYVGLPLAREFFKGGVRVLGFDINTGAVRKMNKGISPIKHIPHETLVPVGSCEVAEAAKILENTYRCVNIAMVNELKMLFDRMGIDVWEVIRAASTKPFGFHPFYPGPGLGGHCIPIDPFYLTWKAMQYGLPTKFIELAGEINTDMPHYVVQRVMEALNDRRKSLKGAKVLILGLAYKPDIDDLRESPSLELIELLRDKGARVDYNDPYIPQTHKQRSYDLHMKSNRLTPAVLGSYDVVLIATHHSDYDYPWIVAHSRLVVDTRNATMHVKRGRHKIVKA